MHFSLHSDKRRGVDQVEKGPPTRLIELLRLYRLVSFASLTLRLLNVLCMGILNIFLTTSVLMSLLLGPFDTN